MLSHGNLAANTATLVDYWGFSENDVLLPALPIYHAHGLFVALGWYKHLDEDLRLQE